MIASALALLLPTACGLVLWQALLGRPRGVTGWCAALGAGYLAGAVTFGALLTFCNGAMTPSLFRTFAPWLTLFAAIVGVSGWRLSAAVTSIDAPCASARERGLIALLLVLLALTAFWLFEQAAALPSLSWDAWNAWFAKSKAWYFAGEFVPAGSFDAWSAAEAGTTISTEAWVYPEALPRFAVWLASAAGGWNESAVQVAWPLAWLALGLACFGYLGMAGVRTAHALVSAAALLLLPLVTAHAALAGYADLWLAAMLLLACAHVARWFQRRNWRDAAAAAMFATLLPVVKAEGAIWLLCLIGATALFLLPLRWRLGLLLGGVALWAVAIPFGGLPLPLPGLGVARLDWGAIEIPTRGVMSLSWRPVLDEVAQALFLLPNFALLWYLAPLMLALRWRALRDTPGLAALGGFLALGYAMLFVLFFFTDASAWAESYTSVNRVLMQIVPVTVLWLSLLWARPARPDKAPSTAR